MPFLKKSKKFLCLGNLRFLKIQRDHSSRSQCYLLFSLLQEDVYEATTKNLIDGVIAGYNATVFAYGPTGNVDVSF